MKKQCEKCGSEALVILSSLNQKICADCQHVMAWKLERGQKSLLIEGLVGEESKNEKE